MAKGTRLSPEVRERAVRLVHEHADDHGSRLAAIRSVAAKIGCPVETLRKLAHQRERDVGKRTGLTTDEPARVKALEREVNELRRSKEILRMASACFAPAELDRRGT